MQKWYNEIWMKQFPRVLDHMTYIGKQNIHTIKEVYWKKSIFLISPTTS